MQNIKQHDGNCSIYMGCLVNHYNGECPCPPKCNCGVEAIHINMSTLESKGDKLMDVKMGGEKKFKVGMQDISQWKEELRKEFIDWVVESKQYHSTDDYADYWLSKFDTLLHKAITEERERIVKALIGQAEPYENSKWHNQLSIETIKNIISNE